MRIIGIKIEVEVEIEIEVEIEGEVEGENELRLEEPINLDKFLSILLAHKRVTPCFLCQLSLPNL